MNNRHILDRQMSNSGPMTPPQVRAMWAKRINPTSEQSTPPSDRPYIPVPRVPIPGYPKNPPPQSGGSERVDYSEKIDEQEPQETYYEKIMRQIAEIRARGAVPPGAQLYTREDALDERGRSGKLPKAPPLPVAPYRGKPAPKPGSKNGIWSGGDTPDPALKKKRYPWEGRINNRFAAVINFLAQHAR